jgi:hypothetical protein
MLSIGTVLLTPMVWHRIKVYQQQNVVLGHVCVYTRSSVDKKMYIKEIVNYT